MAADGDAAAGTLVKARQTVDELRLAVSVDTGDADDLTGPHVKADIMYGILLVQMGGDGEALHAEHHIAGMGLVLVDLQLYGAAHHHVGQLLLVGVLGVDRADVLALAQHRDPVGHRHDLVEFVGDEEDGLALPSEILHDEQQLIDFLRRQYGGGLVEDEDLVVPVEHLQDLHTLLHTDSDVLHLGVQIYRQTVPLRQLLYLFPGLLLLQKAHLRGLGPQNDIVQHREHVHQLEVLMHHTDPQRCCVVGVIDLYCLSIFSDLAFFRLVQTEQDGHQRGFTGAIFPQKGVDLALPQLKGDVVIGLDAGKLLGDVKHFDHILRRIFHAATYFLRIYRPIQVVYTDYYNGSRRELQG